MNHFGSKENHNQILLGRGIKKNAKQTMTNRPTKWINLQSTFKFQNITLVID